VLEAVRRMIAAGIPVMGHLGLTPQSVNAFGGYKVQARGEADQERLMNDARALQAAGCFALVLEGIPAKLGADVSRALTIPTIGIGAGAACDGQVLVTHDLLGLFQGHKPKFVRRYAELGDAMRESFERYIADVKARRFPGEQESY
jgi:3-methyl-2-oxobutanoate hydroxymethyltransferase